MSTIKITDADFEQKVLNSDKPVLVDFWAEWCGPCKQLGPILEEMAGELGETVTIAKINIDENPEAPTKFGVRSIPTMILFKGGEAAAIKIGVQPKAKLVEWINDNA